MTTIRVDPASVRSYAGEAQRIFDEMHQALVSMVNELVGVHYYGPNAVTFKRDCGRLSADFANRLHVDMSAMADAVRSSTSNIAASLGGAPIVIRLDSRPITPPEPQTTDYVDVETEALRSMIGVVNQRFAVLESGLDAHLTRLQATDWQGNAKESAVQSVRGFTTSARRKCEEAKQQISTYINTQLEDVTLADQ